MIQAIKAGYRVVTISASDSWTVYEYGATNSSALIRHDETVSNRATNSLSTHFADKLHARRYTEREENEKIDRYVFLGI